jgi:hypothetical protein
MSFEPLIIQKWIYDTLSADSTLAGLLAGQKAKNYQQGIYAEIAPEKDAVSQKMPQLPYIVFSRAGSDASDQFVICGARYLTSPLFRVTIWDQSNGSLSYKNLKSIADRVDVLLDQQNETIDGISYLSQRYDTDQPFEVQSDGRVDYGLTLLYKFITII